MNRHLALVTASMVIVVAFAMVLFGGGPSKPAHPSATPSPASPVASPLALAALASPSTVAPSPAPRSVPGCSRGAFPVRTGEDMPEAVETPAALDRRVDLGVYVTSPIPPLESSQGFEIWAVRHGTRARRIGVSADRVVVDDLAPDGSFAVLSIDHPRPGLDDCFDLVTIATNGSGARWIAGPAPASRTLGARLAPAGTLVGWTEMAQTVDAGWLELGDIDGLGTGATINIACGPGSPDEKAWSPDGRRLAAVCQSDFVVVDTGGHSQRFPLPSSDAVQGFAWSSPAVLEVAMTPASNEPAPVTVWRLDTTSSPSGPGAFSKRWVSTPPVTLVQDGETAGLTPDGRRIFVRVDDGSTDFAWKVIDLRTGRARNVSGGQDRTILTGGTPDGGRAAFVTSAGIARSPSLEVVDLGSSKETSFGALPETYTQGRWRLP